jgi:hypothetical protein
MYVYTETVRYGIIGMIWCGTVWCAARGGIIYYYYYLVLHTDPVV